MLVSTELPHEHMFMFFNPANLKPLPAHVFKHFSTVIPASVVVPPVRSDCPLGSAAHPTACHPSMALRKLTLEAGSVVVGAPHPVACVARAGPG